MLDVASTDGIQLVNTNLINVVNNKINASGARYGINVGSMSNGLINGNVTQGFTTSSYHFEGALGGVYLQNPLSDATTQNGLYTFASITSGYVVGQNIQTSFGIPTLGYWYQGSTFINAAPTAGGYLGYICTATGNPGTWKTYGAISA